MSKKIIKVINSKEYRCYSIFYPVGNGGFNIDKSIEDILWIKDEVLKENWFFMTEQQETLIKYWYCSEKEEENE